MINQFFSKMEENVSARGGSREGAGRKPKADEIAKIDMMDSIAEPIRAWEELWKLCEKGDGKALQVWIDHRFGKPKENKEHNFLNLPFEGIINEFRNFGETKNNSE